MPVCNKLSSYSPTVSPAGRSRVWPGAVRMSRPGRWQGPALMGLVVRTVVLALLLVALVLGSSPFPGGSRPGERPTALVASGLSHPWNSIALEDDDRDADDPRTAGTLALPSAPAPQGHAWLQVRLPVRILFLTRPQLLTRL
jgi:hypothetical protein